MPGANRAVWVWRPKNARAGDELILTECPVAYISAESQHLVLLFLACRSLHAPPYAEGLLHWPARLVDALLLLEQECAKTDA